MPINNSTLPAREEYLRKKRNKRMVKFTITFFCFVIVVAISSYLFHRKEVRISKVILRGGLLVTESDIGGQSLKYMNGSYIWLYPKNVSFWYPRKSLETYLKQNFKRIDDISIHLDGFNTMIIDIEERKPFAIWCEGMPDGKNIEDTLKISTTTAKADVEYDDDATPKCYFIDQDSTIFSEAPYFSGDAYFKFYGLISTSTPIGNYFISSSTKFEEISNFIESVKSMSIRPLYLVANDNGDFSLVVSGGGKIFFDIKKPLKEVSQNLESLLRTPALSTSTNRDLPIEYIDLRYGNKLFYKLRGE